jgi:hypothetical protein
MNVIKFKVQLKWKLDGRVENTYAIFVSEKYFKAFEDYFWESVKKHTVYQRNFTKIAVSRSLFFFCTYYIILKIQMKSFYDLIRRRKAKKDVEVIYKSL